MTESDNQADLLIYDATPQVNKGPSVSPEPQSLFLSCRVQ